MTILSPRNTIIENLTDYYGGGISVKMTEDIADLLLACLTNEGYSIVRTSVLEVLARC